MVGEALNEFCGTVGRLSPKPLNGQPGRSACSIDRFIAFPSPWRAVTPVVQLNRNERPHGGEFAEQEVHVLLDDPIPVSRVLVGADDVQHVGQVDLGADQGSVGDRKSSRRR